jgi:uncharacterized oligopeptide transporter (OPT) family protein
MRIIDLTVGLIMGIIFTIAILLVLTIFFVVLIPFLFYFTVREVLKYLTKR